MERYVMVDTFKAYPLELGNYPEYQDDIELVQIAVKKNGMALQYASELLKNNKTIVQQAVTSDGNALQYVPEELRSDRELVLKASHTCNAQFIPQEFLADKEIAWNLMGHDCDAFAFLADELRNNIEFVVEAVRKNLDMLMYVPDIFFENRENVLTLVSENAAALQEAPDHFKNDKEIATVAMKAEGSPWAYSVLSDELQRDAEIIRTLVYNINFNCDDELSFIDLFISENIPEELLQDEDFVRRIAEIYECSVNRIYLDKRLVLRMIELCCIHEGIFDDEILDDPDVESAIEQCLMDDEC